MIVHDVTLSALLDPIEYTDFPTPLGDPIYDPSSRGNQTFPLPRFTPVAGSGINTTYPRISFNTQTHFMDSSLFYGCSEVPVPHSPQICKILNFFLTLPISNHFHSYGTMQLERWILIPTQSRPKFGPTRALILF